MAILAIVKFMIDQKTTPVVSDLYYLNEGLSLNLYWTFILRIKNAAKNWSLISMGADHSTQEEHNESNQSGIKD